MDIKSHDFAINAGLMLFPGGLMPDHPGTVLVSAYVDAHACILAYYRDGYDRHVGVSLGDQIRRAFRHHDSPLETRTKNALLRAVRSPDGLICSNGSIDCRYGKSVYTLDHLRACSDEDLMNIKLIGFEGVKVIRKIIGS